MEELHNQHPPEQGHAMRFQPTPPPLPLPLPLLFSSPKQSPRSRDSLSTVEVVSRLPDSGVEGSSSSSLVPSENHDRSKPTHDQTSAQIEVLERRLLLLEQQYLVHARPHSKLDEQTSRPVDSERQPPRAQERAAPSKASSGSIRSARACGAGRSSAAAAAAEPAASNPATAVSDLDMGQDPRSSEDEIQGPSLFLHLRHPEHASSSDKRQLAENWERSNAETADPEGGLRDGVSEEPGQEATELNYRCQELGLQPRNESSLDSHCKGAQSLGESPLAGVEAEGPPPKVPLLGHAAAAVTTGTPLQLASELEGPVPRVPLLGHGRPAASKTPLKQQQPVPESRFTSRSSRPASIVKAALVANPITTAAVKLPLARCKSKPVEEWQENDVCEWLIEEASAPVGITRVVHDNAITGNVLLSLTEDDVDTLHVEKFGHRRLLLLAAQDIRSAISSRRPNQPNLPNAQDIFSSHEKKLAQLDDEHRAEHKHVAQDAKDGSGGDGACNEQQTAQHHTDQKALPSQSLQPPQKKLCEAGASSHSVTDLPAQSGSTELPVQKLPNRPRSAELPVHRGPSSPMLAAPPCAPAVTALSACRAIPRGASVRVPGAVALRSGSTLSPRSSSTSSGVPCRNLEQRKIHLVQAHAAAPALACPAFSQAVREAEVSQLLSPRYAAVVAARTTIATTSSGGALTPRVAGTPCLRALSGPPGGTAGVRNHRSQHPQLVCSWQYQQQTAAFPIFSTPPTPAPPARMAFCTAPVPAPMEPVAVAGGLCGPQRPHSQERGCQTAPHAATSYPGMVQPPSEHSNAKVCSRTSLADADLDGGRCAALTPRVLTPGGLSAEASAGRAAYIARFGHRTMVRPRSGHLSSPRP
eukprot:TRINITY_DN19290_c0_g1_i2.p1 TRINITY_DN19290_c0_g1~~TRINITY_DN19290_c0_g1_i2.p1  ORF type:complete len:869 (-),score=135.26 TRINITY_DN19290_c0_g1_i2:32-2638(-)